MKLVTTKGRTQAMAVATQLRSRSLVRRTRTLSSGPPRLLARSTIKRMPALLTQRATHLEPQVSSMTNAGAVEALWTWCSPRSRPICGTTRRNRPFKTHFTTRTVTKPCTKNGPRPAAASGTHGRCVRALYRLCFRSHRSVWPWTDQLIRSRPSGPAPSRRKPIWSRYAGPQLRRFVPLEACSNAAPCRMGLCWLRSAGLSGAVAVMA